MKTLDLNNVQLRYTAEGVAYARGETAGRRYYSVDSGKTWHRTLARALRGDRRGREGRAT